tara:strand:+ start:330 stop:1193 length:864 start_codon:yes stop_codon:yes gene_type:complete
VKTILTGKTGLIGSHIKSFFDHKNHELTTFGRNDCDYYLDLNNFDLSKEKEKLADTVIHCAGVTDEEISTNLESSIKKNTLGLVKFVDWSLQAGVKRFIYISSAHVYGNLNQNIDEKTELIPKSLYANLHIFAENYIRSNIENVTIIRPNAVFGKVGTNFNRWGLIPFSFPKSLFQENKITIKSHGKQQLNFVSADTIAATVYESLSDSIFGVINPVGYHTMSVLDFAKYCIKTINQSYEKDFGLEVLSKEDYTSNFKYSSSKVNCKELSTKLNEHILNTYEVIQNG